MAVGVDGGRGNGRHLVVVVVKGAWGRGGGGTAWNLATTSSSRLRGARVCKLRANSRQTARSWSRGQGKVQVEMGSGVTTGRRARVKKQQALHRRTATFLGPFSRVCSLGDWGSPLRSCLQQQFQLMGEVQGPRKGGATGVRLSLRGAIGQNVVRALLTSDWLTGTLGVSRRWERLLILREHRVYEYTKLVISSSKSCQSTESSSQPAGPRNPSSARRRLISLVSSLFGNLVSQLRLSHPSQRVPPTRDRTSRSPEPPPWLQSLLPFSLGSPSPASPPSRAGRHRTPPDMQSPSFLRSPSRCPASASTSQGSWVTSGKASYEPCPRTKRRTRARGTGRWRARR